MHLVQRQLLFSGQRVPVDVLFFRQLEKVVIDHLVIGHVEGSPL